MLDQFEGKRAVVSQILGALLRASLVAILITIPALVVPGVDPDTSQIVLVVALLAGLLTFMEYYGRYPSIVEFRFAAPFNRLKFLSVAAMVIALSMILQGDAAAGGVVASLSHLAGHLSSVFDVVLSPVHLVALAVPQGATDVHIELVKAAASFSYFISLGMILAFVLLVRFLNWPMGKGTFNFWINLPLYDPTRGGDVVERLRRDAGINVLLGFLLPFLIPAALIFASNTLDPIFLTDPHALIWAVTAWAFLPASIVIRGMAFYRISKLIEDKRKVVHAGLNAQDALQKT